METKFTPGPWRCSDNDPYKNGMPYFHIEAARGVYENCQGFCLSGIMSKSDGALIASAPELYAALESAIADLNSVSGTTQSDAFALLKIKNSMEVSLSKARGEKPSS